MKTCIGYLEKQKIVSRLPLQDYAPITVIIPCYDEPAILTTLNSLRENVRSYRKNLHIIVVINHSENSPQNVKEQNAKSKMELINWGKNYASELHTLSIIKTVFPGNSGGVGDARKIGMDEAINQYIKHNKDGILVSLDADTICAPNYLVEIFNHFQKKPQTNTLIIRYEHQLNKLSPKQKNAIVQYELYLRYIRMAYEYAGHPNYFHTIGSAFAVKASAYCKQGGMNHRQAGEDFYFLQKMFRLGHCHELNSTQVYPASRTSTRVPFGTGKAIAEILSSGKEYQTYNFQAFKELKYFFEQHKNLYKISKEDYEYIVYHNLGGLIKSFLIEIDFYTDLRKINANCASLEMFSKKFFETFSVFQIIKYLNFSHTHFLQKVGIFHAILCLPQVKELQFQTPEELLKAVRSLCCRQQ